MDMDKSEVPLPLHELLGISLALGWVIRKACRSFLRLFASCIQSRYIVARSIFHSSGYITLIVHYTSEFMET